MPVLTNKEALCINQLIGQKTETIMVEEDFVVPDIKPDILNTINTNGTICIYKKEIVDGKIKIEGTVNTYIMYLADEENSNIRSLNVNLDFSQTVEFENIKLGMILEDSPILKSVECRVLNGRKIGVKAILDVELKVSSNENFEFVKEVEDIKDIQLLNENMKINSLLGNGLTKVYAKDTFVIDSIDNLNEIMKVNIDIKNKETKISYNKVLAKADACVKIMYLTDDNRICCISNMIPVMGFIDMPNITDENICDMKYEIKNILIKPNNIEEHSIYIEIELELMCNVYETKELNVIQDLYSPTINLAYKQKMIKTMSQKEIRKDLCTIREKQIIDEIGNNQIYDVEVIPQISNQNVLKDRIVYEGELECKFLFASENSTKIDVKNVQIPFNYNMECAGVTQTSMIETKIEVSAQDFVIMPDGSIDIKVDLDFIVNSSNNKNINVIEEINVEENREYERYSIIIYFVKPGDTLWGIAKKFKSTVDAIATINNIENKDKLVVGQQLFIPMSI